MKALIASFMLLLSALPTAAQQGAGPTEPAYLYRAEVRRVIDGDTIEVDIDLGFYTWLHTQRIRLVGIDAPEVRGEERAQGLAATEFLRELVEGKEIIIRTYRVKDGGDEDDKYGRWLGRIYINGLDVNQNIVDEGYAVEADD